MLVDFYFRGFGGGTSDNTGGEGTGDSDDLTSVKNTLATMTTSIANIKSETDKISGIETSTNKLQFDSNNDIKATLDSEEVDIGSVKGTSVNSISDFTSTADLSATNTKIDNVKSVVDNVKLKTDNIEPTSSIASAIWSTLTTGSLTDNSILKLIKDNLDGKITDVPTVTEIENALIDETDGQTLLEAIKTKIGNTNITASAIASEIWNSVTTSTLADNSILKLIVDNLDAQMSSIKTETDKIPTIKTETDKLQFDSNNDIKSTLDNEEVDVGSIKGTSVSSVDDFKASGLPTLSDIEASTVLAKISDLTSELKSIRQHLGIGSKLKKSSDGTNRYTVSEESNYEAVEYEYDIDDEASPTEQTPV